MAARDGTAERRVVVMTDDEDLLDEVVRLAAAAEVGLERVPDAAGLRRRWHTSGMVLVDEEAARAVGPLRLGRRDGVVVLCRGDPPGSLWEHAVGVGAEHVVSLPEGESWLVSALADAGPGSAAGRGRVLAVVGGRGGSGASVLAVAVAAHAGSHGTRVLLVDCDPLGGGLDLLAGAEELEGLRWSGLALGGGGGGRVAAASLHEALPSPDGMVTVLACDRAGAGPDPGAAVAVVEAGRRAGEVVVCDLPRHLTDTALAVADVADLVVVVVPAEVRAVAAAGRVVAPLAERGAVLQLVVRGPGPGGLDADDVTHSLGLDAIAFVGDEPGLASALDRAAVPGLRRGPLQDTAAAVLDALGAAADRGRAA